MQDRVNDEVPVWHVKNIAKRIGRNVRLHGGTLACWQTCPLPRSSQPERQARGLAEESDPVQKASYGSQ
jgi:hypothetical protein